ncbi:MAG: nicotinate phosphoribosyltransferase, partial [Candidatus Omnitrophica bacterium]|nr:nicotinate phosphoribosyltransferase [Candidatus Omnitrophota bacterium]
MKKLIAFITLILFSLNELSFGLGVMPGSNSTVTRQAMLAYANSMFVSRGVNTPYDLLPDVFTGDTPAIQGLEILDGKLDEYIEDETPRSGDFTELFSKDILPPDIKIDADKFPDEKAGVIYKIIPGKLNTTRIVFNQRFIDIWEHINANDLCFEVEDEIKTSLSMAIFDWVMAEVLDDVAKIKGLAEGQFGISPVDIDKSLSHGAWMWFNLSYNSGSDVWYDNGALSEAIERVFAEKDEFMSLFGGDSYGVYGNSQLMGNIRDIALLLNKCFYAREDGLFVMPSKEEPAPARKSFSDAKDAVVHDFSRSKDICISTTSIMKAYEIFKQKNTEGPRYFDLFAPDAPHGSSYIVAAGLEVALDDIRKRVFTEEFLEYLRRQRMPSGERRFSEEFLKYLGGFSFDGDIDAAPEGSIIAPGLPIVRLKCTELEAVLVEDILKNRINVSTNIATKTTRIVQAARGVYSKIGKAIRNVIELGLRRGQGMGHPAASRGAFIGGSTATSNVFAGDLYGVPITGTMAHLSVMLFPPEKEIEAFQMYAEAYPDSSVFLVDTYDTIEGAKKAAQVGKDLLEGKIAGPKSHNLIGIRLDSGNITELSKEVRKILDEAGLTQAKIVASDDLDEEKIAEMIDNGAKIDVYGVGTNLITGGKQATLNLIMQPSYNNTVLRVIGPGGKLEKFIETPHDKGYVNSGNDTVEQVLLPYWRGGKRVMPLEEIKLAQERCWKALEALKAEHNQLSGGQAIPIEEELVVDDSENSEDALLVVDVQPTFMPGGGLGVTEGDKVVPFINKLMGKFHGTRLFASRDVHPYGHISFASSFKGYTGGELLTLAEVEKWTEKDNKIQNHARFTLDQLKTYLRTVRGNCQVLWPDHAVEDATESNIHPYIDTTRFADIIVKGTDPLTDSYSAFFDNLRRPTGLHEKLQAKGIKRIVIAGLATDFCVKWAAEDARSLGYEVVVVDDASKGVNLPDSMKNAYDAFRKQGIKLVKRTDSIKVKNQAVSRGFEKEKPKDETEHPTFKDMKGRTGLTEDMYHLTMGQAFFKKGIHEKPATFDYFYRTAPYGRNNVIVSGLRFFLEGLKDFRFTDENIEYLRKQNKFTKEYLDFLKDFRFKGDIEAMEEGSIAYPNEPIMKVNGTLFETMIIETFILNTMNYNSLAATWAAETSAKVDGVRIDNGLAGAQGMGHMEGSHSSMLGGMTMTTNLDACFRFGLDPAWDLS